MKIGQQIEYRTGLTEFGTGTVTAYNAETEIVQVKASKPLAKKNQFALGAN